MPGRHLSATLLTFAIYGFLTLACYGWGRLTTRWAQGQTAAPLQHTSYVWTGWAITLLLFQLLHFAFPLNAWVVVPVLLVGIPFALADMRQLRHMMRWPSSQRALAIWIIQIVITIGISSWVISRAMLSPEHIDSGSYHFQTIRWLNTYPIVPGLGNLHSRLAFNQAFFPYVAALNFSPFFHQGRSVANSFLFLLSIATFVEQVKHAFRARANRQLPHPFAWLPAVFGFPVLVFLTMNPRIPSALQSPVPDLSATLLQLILFSVVCQIIAYDDAGSENQSARLWVLGILAATSITIKLSNAAFAFLIYGFIYVYCRKHTLNRLGLAILTVSMLIGSVWLARNIVLSGAPLYPSTAFRLPVPWAMPEDKILQELNFIKGWARRTPVEGTQTVIIGDENWLTAWMGVMLKRTTEFAFPLGFAILFLPVNLILHFTGKQRRLSAKEWFITLPVIAGLMYWFISAPDIRFANAQLFLLSTAMLLLFLTLVWRAVERKTWIMVACVVFVTGNIHLAGYVVRHADSFVEFSTQGWYALPDVSIETRTTISGLDVYVPDDLDCWDAPLPCTPLERYDPSLVLIEPGNLGRGFMIQGQ